MPAPKRVLCPMAIQPLRTRLKSKVRMAWAPVLARLLLAAGHPLHPTRQ